MLDNEKSWQRFAFEVLLLTSIFSKPCNSFSKLAEQCISICVDINRNDLVFTSVWSVFSVSHQQTFLSTVEKMVSEKRMTDIPHQFLLLLLSINHDNPQRLEQILLSLEFSNRRNMSSDEFNTLIDHCKANNLYRPLVHVYNIVHSDYKTPLQYMMSVVQQFESAQESNKKLDSAQQATMLQMRVMIYDYLESIFKGISLSTRSFQVATETEIICLSPCCPTVCKIQI